MTYLSMQEFADRQGITLDHARYWRSMGVGPRPEQTKPVLRFRLADVIEWERCGRDLQLR